MVLIAIFMVVPLSIVRWEACPLKLIIFKLEEKEEEKEVEDEEEEAEEENNCDKI